MALTLVPFASKAQSLTLEVREVLEVLTVMSDDSEADGQEVSAASMG